MISILFFFSSLLIGLAILKVTRIVLPLYAKLSLGLVLGTTFSVIGIFLLSWIFKLNVGTVTLFQIPALIVSLIFFLKDYNQRSFFEEFKSDKLTFFSFAAIFVIVLHIFIKSIYIEPEAVIAGNRLVWTDWPIHFAIISSFAQSSNIPPQNHQYAGQILTYPFFSDFLSAVLQTIGENIKNSLVIPGVVLTTAFIFLLFYFGKLITHGKRISAIGILIGIFWGGLGFIYFAQDLMTSTDLIKTFLMPPHEYTFYHEMNLWFFSFLYSEVLPQRAFLLGLPLFFSSLVLLIVGLIKEAKNYLILSALIVGVMPFFHMHGLVSLILFNAIFIPITLLTTLKVEGFKSARKQLTELLTFFVLPAAVLLIPQLLIFYSLHLDQTITPHFGWMKGDENFFVFWFKNTGLFWPILFIALMKTKLSHLQFNVTIAAIFLFVMTNLFTFAKWPYDNLKIMTFWYLICSFIVAKVLVNSYKANLFGKIIAVLLFLSLVLSGSIEVFKVIGNDSGKIQIWSKSDIDMSRSIIDNTIPNSTILAAAQHDHPASTLAGRPVVIGYPGNAWSWGLSDWSQREADVHTMLKGDPFIAPGLLAKYKVKYVIISQRERGFEPNTNEQYFQQIGTLVAAGEDYKLYQLN